MSSGDDTCTVQFSFSISPNNFGIYWLPLSESDFCWGLQNDDFPTLSFLWHMSPRILLYRQLALIQYCYVVILLVHFKKAGWVPSYFFLMINFLKKELESEFESVVHHWPPFRTKRLLTPAGRKAGRCWLTAESLLWMSQQRDLSFLNCTSLHPGTEDAVTRHWGGRRGRAKPWPALLECDKCARAPQLPHMRISWTPYH